MSLLDKLIAKKGKAPSANPSTSTSSQPDTPLSAYSFVSNSDDTFYALEKGSPNDKTDHRYVDEFPSLEYQLNRKKERQEYSPMYLKEIARLHSVLDKITKIYW